MLQKSVADHIITERILESSFAVSLPTCYPSVSFFFSLSISYDRNHLGNTEICLFVLDCCFIVSVFPN